MCLKLGSSTSARPRAFDFLIFGAMAPASSKPSEGPGSASPTTLGANVESLKNMNQNTAKFAKWYVRIIAPRIIPYTFAARNEQVQATKFECVLVSNDPSQ